jgi:hypothetical protein
MEISDKPDCLCNNGWGQAGHPSATSQRRRGNAAESRDTRETANLRPDSLKRIQALIASSDYALFKPASVLN